MLCMYHRSKTMLRITDSLPFKAALALVDVRVLDHIISSDHGVLSMAERGLL